MKDKLKFLKETFGFTKSPLIVGDSQAFGDFLIFAIGKTKEAANLQAEFVVPKPEACKNLKTFLPEFSDWLIVNHWGEEGAEVAA
jgi:hypothetical protein